jgi:hypothetical protein
VRVRQVEAWAKKYNKAVTEQVLRGIDTLYKTNTANMVYTFDQKLKRSGILPSIAAPVN